MTKQQMLSISKLLVHAFDSEYDHDFTGWKSVRNPIGDADEYRMTCVGCTFRVYYEREYPIGHIGYGLQFYQDRLHIECLEWKKAGLDEINSIDFTYITHPFTTLYLIDGSKICVDVVE